MTNVIPEYRIPPIKKHKLNEILACAFLVDPFHLLASPQKWLNHQDQGV